MAGIWGDYHGIPARRCSCGRQFYPKFESARQCYPCWKGKSGPQPVDASALDDARAEIERLRRQLALRDLRIRLAETDLALEREVNAEFRAYVPRLIRLCHPDRHGNSPVANETTRWLLAQRKRTIPNEH